MTIIIKRWAWDADFGHRAPSSVRRLAGHPEPGRFEAPDHRDAGLRVEDTTLEPFVLRFESQRQDVQIVAPVSIELLPGSGAPGNRGVFYVNRHERAWMRGRHCLQSLAPLGDTADEAEQPHDRRL